MLLPQLSFTAPNLPLIWQKRILRSGNEHAFRHTALCLKVKPSSASDKSASKIHKHTQDWDDMQCEEAFHSLSYFSPKPETTSIISKVNKNRYTLFIAITFLVHFSSTNDFCCTKVGNFDVHVCVQQDVFWFQISKQIQSKQPFSLSFLLKYKNHLLTVLSDILYLWIIPNPWRCSKADTTSAE